MDDLSSFKGKSLEELASENIHLNKDFILELHKKKQIPSDVFDAIEYPERLVDIVRRTELRSLQRRLRDISSNIIFETYVDSIIRKNFSDIPSYQYTAARRQQLKNITSEELATMKQEAVQLFKDGLFPTELLDEMRAKLRHLPVITDKEVLQAEQAFNPLSEQEFWQHMDMPGVDAPEVEVKEEEEEEGWKDFDLDELLGEMELEEELVSPGQPAAKDIGGLQVALPPDLPKAPLKFHSPGEEEQKEHKQKRARIRARRGMPAPVEKAQIKAGKMEEFMKAQPAIEDVHIVMKPKYESPIVAKSDDLIIYESPSDNHPPYDSFSPFSFSGMLHINDHIYPSVSHYIIASLLANLHNVGGIDNAWKLLLLEDAREPVDAPEDFKDIPILNMLYDHLSYENFVRRQKAFSKTALKEKFKHRLLQDILLATKNDNLIFADNSDPILGIGEEKNGENYVGKYLEKLRRKIRAQREKSDEVLDVKQLEQYIMRDDYLLTWLRLRTQGMCRSIYMIWQYMEEQSSDSIPLTDDYVEKILNDIFYPCSHLIGLANKVSSKYPNFFKNIVYAQPGFDDADKDVIQLLWNRIIVLIHFLLQLNVSSTTVKTMIMQAQMDGSVKTPCVRIIKNKYQNCILSALINILYGLMLVEYGDEIDEIDITEDSVATAVSILLNQSISVNKMKNAAEISDDDRVSLEHTVAQKFGIDDTNISNYLLQGLYLVQHTPMQNNIKQNRINFFASIVPNDLQEIGGYYERR